MLQAGEHGIYRRYDYVENEIVNELDTGSAITRRYVHGPGTDEPLVWYEGAGTSDRRWLHADERRSIVAISDGTGAVTNINRYDEYGVPDATNAGRWGYTGQYWLGQTYASDGLWHYKARAYAPALGRFLQTDPIGYGDGPNLYAYVGGDPVNFTDPLGLFCSTKDLDAGRECPVVARPYELGRFAGGSDRGKPMGGRDRDGGGGFGGPISCGSLCAPPRPPQKRCSPPSGFAKAAETVADAVGIGADVVAAGAGGLALMSIELPPAGLTLGGIAGIAKGISIAAGGASTYLKASRGDTGGAVSSAAGTVVGSFGRAPIQAVSKATGANLGKLGANNAAAVAGQGILRGGGC